MRQFYIVVITEKLEYWGNYGKTRLYQSQAVCQANLTSISMIRIYYFIEVHKLIGAILID